MFDATLNVGQRHRRLANINPAMVQSIVAAAAYMQVPFVCMWLMIVPAGTKHSPGVGTLLAHSLRCWIGIVPALGGRIFWFVVMTMVDSTHWPSVDLMPGWRRRRWTGIESALGLFLLFAG